MAGTIGSVGHGATGEGKTVWRKLIGSYFGGALLGGLVLGVPLAFAGLALDAYERFIGIPQTYATVGGVTILTLLALRDLGLVSFSLPTRYRQVPMSWKRLPGYWSSFVFGFSLGTGISTTIYLASFYAVGLVAVLVRDLFVGLLVTVTYSVSRGLVILWAAHVRMGPDRLVSRLSQRMGLVSQLNGATTILLALVMLANS